MTFVFQQAGLAIASITRFPIVARFFARGSAIDCTLPGRMTNDRSPVTFMEISPVTRSNSSTIFSCVKVATPRRIHPLSCVKQDDYSIMLRIFHAESTHSCTSPNVSLNFTPPILSFSWPHVDGHRRWRCVSYCCSELYENFSVDRELYENCWIQEFIDIYCNYSNRN